jgi:cullin-associated NEDD8-dissociated protein 1
MTCDQTLYIKLIDSLLAELTVNSTSNTSNNAANSRTHIQAIGAICRQAGHRFGGHVEKVIPLILSFAQVEDDELREHCLQACKDASSLLFSSRSPRCN